jgi:hypothetical protein
LLLEVGEGFVVGILSGVTDTIVVGVCSPGSDRVVGVFKLIAESIAGGVDVERIGADIGFSGRR